MKPHHILSRLALALLVVWEVSSAPPAGGDEAARLIPVGRDPGSLRSARPYLAPGAPPGDASRALRLLDVRRRELHRMGIRDDRSPRQILSPAYQAGHRMAKRGSTAGAPFAPGDTLVVRVAGIRVGFRDQGEATRATFDTTRIWDPAREDTLMIDPPPHDRAFSLKHMEALNQFWQAMFYGRIRLEYDVFPQDSLCYMLDSLGVYAACDTLGTGADWTTEGLTWLVKDCLRAADGDTALHFPDWDAYMIMHAGPDYQTDINRDSPGDIPSFYIYLGDTLWVDATAADSFPLVDASMVPETISQDGLVGAVNGVLAHEFGHQLGLPDLYDIFTGFPSLGLWDLMDSGNNVTIDLGVPVTGVLPAGISAWSRFVLSEFLSEGGGFLNAERVETLFSDSLRAVEQVPGQGPGHVLQIPLTAEEYYLVENRQDDVDGNRAAFVGDSLVILEGITRPTGPDTLTGALYQEKETGVVLGPARFAPRDGAGDLPPFETIRSWEYDAGLPGHGLLVWHVDEEVLYDLAITDYGWAPNGDPNRRGLYLEEADGVMDLGDWRSAFWLGSRFDPFFAGNADSLTPHSVPSTTSSLGGHTGLRITGIDSLGHAMYLRVDRGLGKEGFPLFLEARGERGDVAGAVAAGDVNGDGWEDLVVARGGSLFALAGGAPPGGEELLAGWPVESGASEVGPLALGDLDGDGVREIVGRDSRGRLAAWRGNGAPYFAGPTGSGGAFTESLAVRGGPPLVMDLDGDDRAEIVLAAGLTLRAYADSAGSPRLIWKLPASHLSGGSGSEVVALAGGEDSAAAGDVRIVALFSTGEVAVVAGDGSVVASWLAGPPHHFAERGFVALGDLDRSSSGQMEVLAVGEDGYAAAYGMDGSYVPGQWPVELGAHLAGPPALGDLDHDGRLEVLVPLESVGVAALRANGAMVKGSPWTAPLGESGSPLVADLEGDGPAEILAAAGDGLVYAWSADGTRLPGWPLALGRGPLSPAGIVDLRPGDASPELAVLDGIGALELVSILDWSPAGRAIWEEAFGSASRLSHFTGTLDAPSPGGTLLAGSGAYVYPNPARGTDPRVRLELGADALVTIQVFTLGGELVTEWSGNLRMPVDEWVWDASRMASGLYLCRIRASGAGQDVSLVRKIAVLH